MTIHTLGDFLDRELAFKTQLNSYYAEIRESTADNDTRLLTYFLASNRTRHTSALKTLSPETIEHARKSFFVCDEPFDLEALLRVPTFPPATVKGDELVNDAISQQSALASRYRLILAQATNEDVKAVLSALIQVKERDIDLMKQMLAMHYFDK
jgi:hypothetical protein